MEKILNKTFQCQHLSSTCISMGKHTHIITNTYIFPQIPFRLFHWPTANLNMLFSLYVFIYFLKSHFFYQSDQKRYSMGFYLLKVLGADFAVYICFFSRGLHHWWKESVSHSAYVKWTVRVCQDHILQLWCFCANIFVCVCVKCWSFFL